MLMKYLVSTESDLSNNKRTPEGVYAGCVGVRKNYQYGIEMES